MEIIKGVEIKDLALYFKKEKILLIADLHVGYEEALNKQGIMVPRFHGKDILKRLDIITKELEIETVIINGDLKHEFGTISDQEWRDALRVLDFLLKKCKRIILIKGNHDKILDPIAKKRNVEVADEFIINNTIIVHGDKIPKTLPFLSAKNIIIGHEHPAVSIKHENRVEKFKCFLKGKYNKQTLVVQPSLSLITEGTDVLSEKLLSPFLKQDLRKFKVFIVGDEVLEFGAIKNLI